MSGNDLKHAGVNWYWSEQDSTTLVELLQTEPRQNTGLLREGSGHFATTIVMYTHCLNTQVRLCTCVGVCGSGTAAVVSMTIYQNSRLGPSRNGYFIFSLARLSSRRL